MSAPRLKLFLPLLITALVLATACTSRDEINVIKLTHSLSPTHPVHKAMVFLADQVDSLSQGGMRIDIYPSEQLGSEREALELLQIGSIDMTKVSASPLAQFVPPYRVFSIPYLFRDEEHRNTVLEGNIGQKILLSGEKFGLRGLCYYDAGSRSFYTIDNPIREPADLAGLNIRVMESAMAVKMIKILGGSPTPIAWGELYTALQQGVVDAAENNPPSFYLSHHYEVCKYYSLDEHTSIPDVLMISTRMWNRLTPRQRDIITIAVEKSAKLQKELWKSSTRKALEEVQKAGVEVHYPDKTQFREAVEVMYENYRQNEPEIYQLIQAIRAVK